MDRAGLAKLSPIALIIAVVAAVILTAAGTPFWLAGLLGLAGWGATVAVTRARRTSTPRPARIDPFTLGEPWRFHVRDALQAQSRFTHAVRSGRDGPMRDRLADIQMQVDEAVTACWEVAKRGQQLSDARKSLNPSSVSRELERLQDQQHTEAEGVRHRSLTSQQETIDRMSAQVENAQTRLDVIDAQLRESVARATELATRTDGNDGASELAHDVEEIVNELDALRIGLDEATGGTTAT